MFNKEDHNVGVKEAETIIGPSIKVKGNFHGQGNIIIEGQVEGSVKTNSFLLVGDKARVNANIEAKEARIGGEVNGNIKIEGYLELTASARINGDIRAVKISIEKNAVFNGNCVTGSKQQHSDDKK